MKVALVVYKRENLNRQNLIIEKASRIYPSSHLYNSFSPKRSESRHTKFSAQLVIPAMLVNKDLPRVPSSDGVV